jgi:hypothetical protein
VVKTLVRKLLFSVVACVVKYIGPLDAHVCSIWWVVFSLAGFLLRVMFGNMTQQKTQQERTQPTSSNTSQATTEGNSFLTKDLY